MAVRKKPLRGIAAAVMAAYLTLAPKAFASQESKPEDKKAPFQVTKLSLETTLSSSSENNRVYAGAGLPLGFAYRSLNELTYGTEGASYFAKHDIRHTLAGPLSATLAYYFVPYDKNQPPKAKDRNEPKLGLHLDMPKFLGLEGFVERLYDLRNAEDNVLMGCIQRKFSNRGHVGMFVTTKPARHKLYFELEAALRIKNGIYLFGQLCDSNTKDAMFRGGIKINLVSK